MLSIIFFSVFEIFHIPVYYLCLSELRISTKISNNSLFEVGETLWSFKATFLVAKNPSG